MLDLPTSWVGVWEVCECLLLEADSSTGGRPGGSHAVLARCGCGRAGGVHTCEPPRPHAFAARLRGVDGEGVVLLALRVSPPAGNFANYVTGEGGPGGVCLCGDAHAFVRDSVDIAPGAL